MMAAGTGAVSRRGVLAPQEMQEIRGLQFRCAISLAGFVDQKRKGDARFFTEDARVITVAQSDRGKSGSFVPEGLLVFAQLRDMLAAKDSSVVPEKNQNSGLAGPQGAKTNLLPIAIGKGDLLEPATERIFHSSSILSRGNPAVKYSTSELCVFALDALISSGADLRGLRV